MTALSNLLQIFIEPSKAFAELKERPRVWLPLLLVLINSVAIIFWYFDTIDFSWLHERVMSAQLDLEPEQRSALETALTKNRMLYSALANTLVGIPIIFSMYALYYFFASKFMGSDIPYLKWFAFSSWVSVPVLIGFPLAALQILTGKGQIGMEDLNMLSLNSLITHFPVDHPFFGVMGRISLTTFWTIFLSFVGLKVWTSRSTISCAFVSLLPYVVFYGGMLGFAFFK